MSRDYKQRNATRNRKGSGSMMLGLFIGYTLGLASAIGVWLYISQAPSPYLTEEKIAKSAPPEKSTQKSAKKEAPSDANQASLNKPRFDFYNILPGIDEPAGEDLFEPPPSPRPAPVAPAPATPAPPEKKAPAAREHYYIQTGSFRNPGDAERMKAELALLGVVASVQVGKSADNMVLHRVRIGPFNKLEEVNQVRSSLQASGMATSLVRAPGNGQ
ncbi:MAG TPA: SPOR domain-containing protein [Nitrosomonas halophila]|nr:SPOR domain-containing protein [Nitrosomonas halophila]